VRVALVIDKSGSPPDFSELILGTAQLAAPYGITASVGSERTRDTARSILETAFQIGIRTLDTAPAYGDAETIIGEFGGGFSIHTKVLKGLAPSQSLRQSLKQLRRSNVDLLYLHDVDQLRSDPDRTLSQLMNTRQNLGCGIGVSIYEHDDLSCIPDAIRLDSVQVPINVLDRRFAGSFISEQRAIGRRLYARSLFLQGALLATPSMIDSRLPSLAPFVRAFQERCAEVSISLLVGCLAWARSVSGIDGFIVGAQSVIELEEICAAWLEAPKAPAGIFDDLETPNVDLIDPRKW
jgi:aryl-alcohol dehydrogenase-like predicted oxidoreductase